MHYAATDGQNGVCYLKFALAKTLACAGRVIKDPNLTCVANGAVA